MHAHADITSTHIRHMVFIDIYPTSHLSVRMCLCPIQFNGTYTYVRRTLAPNACLPASLSPPICINAINTLSNRDTHTHTRPVKSQLKCRKSIMHARTHGVPGTLNPVPHGTAIARCLWAVPHRARRLVRHRLRLAGPGRAGPGRAPGAPGGHREIIIIINCVHTHERTHTHAALACTEVQSLQSPGIN